MTAHSFSTQYNTLQWLTFITQRAQNMLTNRQNDDDTERTLGGI